jgi:hydroxypyruvate isomerase
MAAGERGLVSVPSAAKSFRENIEACAEIARRTGCRRLNAAYGNRIDGADPAEQDAVAIEKRLVTGARPGRPVRASSG